MDYKNKLGGDTGNNCINFQCSICMSPFDNNDDIFTSNGGCMIYANIMHKDMIKMDNLD